MKNLWIIAVTIICLFALALPVFAGDGGPMPVCKPGTDCSVRLPDGSLNNRPACCSLLPPRMDMAFGAIDIQDRTIAPFSVKSRESSLVAGDGGPMPVCKPGTDCSVRLPDGSLNNRPACCELPVPHNE